MNKLKLGLIALCAVYLCGCAAAPSKINPLNANAPYVIDMDASRRAIDVIPRTDGKGVTTCAEPSPDVALQVTSQILASVAAQNPSVSASVQVQFNTAVVQLAGRNSTLLFLRESLYRLCEQSVNEKLTSDQTMELYRIAMQTALTLSQGDLAKHNADLAQSLQDPEVRKMWGQVTGQQGSSAPAPQPAPTGGVASPAPVQASPISKPN